MLPCLVWLSRLLQHKIGSKTRATNQIDGTVLDFVNTLMGTLWWVIVMTTKYSSLDEQTEAKTVHNTVSDAPKK